jgi:hypothetical protein
MAESRSSIEASSAIDSIDTDSADHRNSVHQRLRANSTIMQVKKLLGKLYPLLFLFVLGVSYYDPVLLSFGS